MKREILFEVRRFDTKEIIGYERVGDRGHWEHKRIKRDEWLLGAITDGQEYSMFIRREFIGLTDKNGTKIFECDKVRGYHFNGEFKFDSVVEFKSGQFKTIVKGWEANSAVSSWAIPIEVIGNIYEDVQP